MKRDLLKRQIVDVLQYIALPSCRIGVQISADILFLSYSHCVLGMTLPTVVKVLLQNVRSRKVRPQKAGTKGPATKGPAAKGPEYKRSGVCTKGLAETCSDFDLINGKLQFCDNIQNQPSNSASKN